MTLQGRRILVTGVLTRESIAYALAHRLAQDGAELVLTGFGRSLRITARAARQLDPRIEVLDLDVTDESSIVALADELGRRWSTLDGLVHSIAHAEPDAIGGRFVETSQGAALRALQVSAVSLQSLTAALRPLLAAAERSSVVALDFDSTRVWPGYDWMGVAKEALVATARHLAAYLGGEGIRVNLVSSGPLKTPAASAIPGFAQLAEQWAASAPLGWDPESAAAVADAAHFLLSDASRFTTGERLHVDGGIHVIAAPATAALEPAAVAAT